MKLAEALSLRSSLEKRVEQLGQRIRAAARYQEGEEPEEEPQALLAEANEVFMNLEELIAKVNQTNSLVTLDRGQTLTEALAHRDVLGKRHRFVTSIADEAAGTGRAGGVFRGMRSELRMIVNPGLSVLALRASADQIARELRELDGKIQQAGWMNDLVE